MVPRPIFELKIIWIPIVKYFELIALSFGAGTFGTLTDAGGQDKKASIQSSEMMWRLFTKEYTCQQSARVRRQ